MVNGFKLLTILYFPLKIPINRKGGIELRFDINELKKYYEIADSQKLISLAYSYESNITYVKEEEYFIDIGHGKINLNKCR